MTNRACLALLAFGILTGCGGDPPETILREAEQGLVLPSDAYPLSWYDRYYVITGEKAIGIMIANDAKHGQFSIVPSTKQLPYRADGGCSVVRVEFDFRTHHWQKPFCHG